MYCIFTAYTNTESRIYRSRISRYLEVRRALSLLTPNLSRCIPRQFIFLPFLLSFIIYVPRTLSNVASRLSTISSIARCIYECFHICCSQNRSQVQLPRSFHTYLWNPSNFLSFCFEKGGSVTPVVPRRHVLQRALLRSLLTHLSMHAYLVTSPRACLPRPSSHPYINPDSTCTSCYHFLFILVFLFVYLTYYYSGYEPSFVTTQRDLAI